MIEAGLIAALFFILIAIIASYLLKRALHKSGISKSVTEETTVIAMGMPPITSLKADYLLPGTDIPGMHRLGAGGKIYLGVARIAFMLAILAIALAVIVELM